MVEWVSVWALYCQVLLWGWSSEAWERQTDCLSFHGVLMPPAIFLLGSSEGHNVGNAQLWAFPSQINCITMPEINELHRILISWNECDIMSISGVKTFNFSVRRDRKGLWGKFGYVSKYVIVSAQHRTGCCNDFQLALQRSTWQGIQLFTSWSFRAYQWKVTGGKQNFPM